MNPVTFKQIVKFGVVGLLNTGITLFVIYVFNRLLGISLYTANIMGYIAGLINSFFWNRHWTFRSASGKFPKQATFFLISWGICYLAQLGILYVLENRLNLHDYIATIIGMLFYTGLNFVLNKTITFKY